MDRPILYVTDERLIEDDYGRGHYITLLLEVGGKTYEYHIFVSHDHGVVSFGERKVTKKEGV